MRPSLTDSESGTAGYHHSDAIVPYGTCKRRTVNLNAPGVTPDAVGWLMGTHLVSSVLLLGKAVFAAIVIGVLTWSRGRRRACFT